MRWAAALWLVPLALALAGMWGHDALGALPVERVLWAVGLTVAHGVGAAVATLACAVAGLRWAPARWGAVALPGLAAVVWATALPGATPPPGRAAPGTGPDVLLITLDTLRADHVDVATTPAIAAVAAAGATYTRAYTTAPLTAPAHASLFTGAEPWEHGLVANGRRATGSVVPTLHDAGYHTAAFVSAKVVDRSTGLHAGFDHYDDRWGDGRLSWIPGGPSGEVVRRGDRTVDRFGDWLGTVDDGPWFAWVHLYDPHAPYDPPGMFRPDPDALGDADARDADDAVASLSNAVERLVIGRPGQQRLLYAAEVRWTDHLVGRLVDLVGPDTVVLIVGDHGESLGDNGYWFNHGARVWESTVHVPLVVRWPGVVPAGVTTDALVGVQDVAGTLLALAGRGTSPLVDALDGTGRVAVTAYTTGQEARPTIGYRDGRPGWRRGPVAARRFADGKLVVFRGEPPLWFDLDADPHEREPLPVPAHRTVDAAELEALVGRTVPALTDHEREHLRALGYSE